jgi:2Fe-2S ferredoxin
VNVPEAAPTIVGSVSVRPWGIRFSVERGETVFDAAFREGWLWPTTCFGQAQCTRCHMKVLSGGGVLEPPTAVEAPIVERLLRVSHRKEPGVEIRLACQARPTGDVEVELKQAPQRRTEWSAVPKREGRSPEGEAR